MPLSHETFWNFLQLWTCFTYYCFLSALKAPCKFIFFIMRTFYFYFFFLPLTGNYTFTPSWLLNSFALLILYRKYLPSFYVIYKIVCINVLHHTELKIRNELKYCKILIWSIISVGVDVNKSNKIFIIEFHTTIFICYFFFMYLHDFKNSTKNVFDSRSRN